ncbi:MAG: bifunctional DNA-formamidopyrimidine glycosylase/DNA-(apurinic or apyrimidinic site) lyase [Cyanobium sp. MAG06]|nr:bifunctional DNA-formamidopyrimidine glycosylase/DNA-(apurinic or apyrimidinic site) lyase [Cyanobium sp. MAG06]
MPELPEVESIRLGLLKVLRGKIIYDIKIIRPKIVSSHSNKRVVNKDKSIQFINGIKNKKIKDITRRAKNISIILEDNSVILIHLKMTGQLVYVDTNNNKTIGGHPIIEAYKDDLPNKHSCIIFDINKDSKNKIGQLFYNDVRQFGYVLYYDKMEDEIERRHFGKIGMEPFDKDFTLEYFIENIQKKNKSIKSILLEQSVVVGCGNIYSDEVCFASNVLPNKNCKKLNKEEMKRLYNNIKKILQKAIDNGGSSVSDYLLADGSRGNYAKYHKVYGRGKLPCMKCKTILKNTIISGRNTVYCEECQR